MVVIEMNILLLTYPPVRRNAFSFVSLAYTRTARASALKWT